MSLQEWGKTTHTSRKNVPVIFSPHLFSIVEIPLRMTEKFWKSVLILFKGLLLHKCSRDRANDKKTTNGLKCCYNYSYKKPNEQHLAKNWDWLNHSPPLDGNWGNWNFSTHGGPHEGEVCTIGRQHSESGHKERASVQASQVPAVHHNNKINQPAEIQMKK